MISVLVFVAATVGEMSQAQEPPGPPWRLESELPIQIDLPADLRLAAGSDLDYEAGEPVRAVAVDLNGDGVNDYLLQSAPRLCGNGGCVWMVCDGATRRSLGRFFGSPIYIHAQRSHGYPNVATYSHQSAGSGNYTEYRFDGRTYVVASARTVEGAAVDRLFETLQRVPLWRPGPP